VDIFDGRTFFATSRGATAAKAGRIIPYWHGWSRALPRSDQLCASWKRTASSRAKRIAQREAASAAVDIFDERTFFATSRRQGG